MTMTPEIRKFIDESRAVCDALLVESRECIDSGVDLITVDCKVITDWSAALSIIEKQAKRIEELEKSMTTYIGTPMSPMREM